MELVALECLKTLKLKDNVVTSIVPSFLIGSSSILQVTKTTIKAWMSLNFKQNQPQIVELTALERLKKST